MYICGIQITKTIKIMENENKKPSNPNTFPFAQTNDAFYAQDGMSLRDYFAAKAMQGMIQSDEFRKLCASKAETNKAKWQDILSDNAFILADAMLKQREL